MTNTTLGEAVRILSVQVTDNQYPMPNAQCPMPNTQYPMPNAQ
ncbi:hypothetical protein [Nostoc sp. GT001]|nr:hypothetical protein [Nostoc sp. GT001]MDM9586063.1 hypothetical protein [Nostoc sp. GT001]